MQKIPCMTFDPFLLGGSKVIHGIIAWEEGEPGIETTLLSLVEGRKGFLCFYRNMWPCGVANAWRSTASHWTNSKPELLVHTLQHTLIIISILNYLGQD